MARSCAAVRPNPTVAPEWRTRHLRIGCSSSLDIAAEAPIMRRMRMHVKDSYCGEVHPWPCIDLRGSEGDDRDGGRAWQRAMAGKARPGYRCGRTVTGGKVNRCLQFAHIPQPGQRKWKTCPSFGLRPWKNKKMPTPASKGTPTIKAQVIAPHSFIARSDDMPVRIEPAVLLGQEEASASSQFPSRSKGWDSFLIIPSTTRRSE